MHKKGNAHMDKIIAAIGVVGAIVVVIVTKIMDLNGFVTAAIVILACAVAVISVARIKPKESYPEKDS
jgi:FtsH-binding integral membrane protein